MPTIHREVTINRPVQAVFDYFANPDQEIARATPDIEVERVTPGPTSVGSEFRFRHASGPVRVSTSRFTVVDPPHELQFVGVVGALRPWNRLTFESKGPSTTVHLAGRANPTGAMRLLTPLATVMGRRLWDARLAKAKAALESHS